MEFSDASIRISFNGQMMIARLYDNPAARELAAMPPLELKIDDFSNNEKIVYLPQKLSGRGSEPFGNEQPGDLCYYKPWGNLAFFYAGYRYSDSLIRLGRIEDYTALQTRGPFPVRIEKIEKE